MPCTGRVFVGSGTTSLVAAKLGRNSIGIELNESYASMARERIADTCGLLCEVTSDAPRRARIQTNSGARAPRPAGA